MNSKRSLSLAMITLSASALGLAAVSRTRFNVDPVSLDANFIGDGNDEGGGDKAAVDTSVAGTGVNTEQLQQDQANSTIIGQTQQQQQGGPGAPQADAEPKAASEITSEAKPVGELGERQPE